MEPVIETYDLTKYYPRNKTYREIILSPFKISQVPAIANVNLKVDKGSILGLLGPNGAGKTTLLKILSTLVHPSSGHAVVNGFDVVSQGNQVRRSIGIVMTEERSFFWRLTGRQNLQFFATFNNLFGRERDQTVNEVLHQTELEKEGDRMFKDYSTGMKQRLAIARGLLCDPDIVLLDEPTRSLDPYTSHHMRTFIKEKIVGHKKRTAILATHNLQEAEELCTHVAIIKDGRIMTQGTMEKVKSKISSQWHRIRLSAGSLTKDIGNFPGVIESRAAHTPDQLEVKTKDISEVLRSILEEGAVIKECNHIKPSLEDIFSKVIEAEGSGREGREI